MRQFRTYGSARGAARKGGPYRDQLVLGEAARTKGNTAPGGLVLPAPGAVLM